jgi:DNA-binding transcriptional LysR family regulator
VREKELKVELRRLRYFVAVAEELHFRRAAANLHLAQPALSQQVRKLELELGVDLLHRNKRSVALTQAGVVFLDEARRVLRYADEAARTARDVGSGAAGRLRVGHLADAVPVALPRVIAGFATRHPGVEVCPETVPARRAIEDVRAGRLDIAVIGLPAPTEGLRVVRVGSEGTIAALSRRHPLSGRDSIPFECLADERLIVLPRAVNPSFYDGVIAACRSTAISPAIVEASEPNVTNALLTVASGGGLALLPTSAAERHRSDGIIFAAVEPPAPETEVAFVARASTNEVGIEAFLRLAEGMSRGSAPTLAAVPDAAAA